MNVKFTTTTRAKLGTLAITNGQIIALSDAVGYYYDMGNVRYPASSITVVSELPEYGTLNMMYVVTSGDTATIYYWDDTQYIQIAGSGASIDDTTASTVSVYSSSKTEELVASIINDTVASTATAYSSSKTDEQIAAIIDDSASSTATAYSSSKTDEQIAALIDDTAASTATVYSSDKVDDKIDAIIDDSASSTVSSYSSSKIDQLIQGITSLTIEIVQALPTEDIDPHKIYFLERTVPGEGNVYDEYMYISDDWELIGTTEIQIATATTATAGIVKPDGTTITVANDGTITAVGGGSSGHVIMNDAGSTLSAEDNLQFKGAYVEDDSTNGKTVVNVVRQMNYADVAQLSAAEKKGIIITERDTNNPATALLNAANITYSNVISQLSASTVQGAVDELKGDLDTLEQSIEDANTMIASTLSAGSTTVSFTSSRITENSIIDPYVWCENGSSVSNIAPSAYSCSTGECVLTFSEQSADVKVGILVK